MVFPPLDGPLHFHEMLERILKVPNLQSAGLTHRFHLNENHLGVVLDEGTVQGNLLFVSKLLAVHHVRGQDKHVPSAVLDTAFHRGGCIYSQKMNRDLLSFFLYIQCLDHECSGHLKVLIVVICWEILS